MARDNPDLPRVSPPDEGRITPETPRRYRLGTEALGHGGMGRVRAAYDRHLGRRVALKEPNESTEQGRARFVFEARVAAGLDHPGIIPVYELGVRPDGTLYYTTREIRGGTLEAAIGLCTTPEQRLALLPHFERACEAVAYAHSRGVLHRDIKPANIMVGPFGETVVIDWGVALRVEDGVSVGAGATVPSGPPAAPRLTESGEIVGTPSYASPEQLRGESVDRRTDVWGLGSVLYEMLHGHPPGEGQAETLSVPLAGGPLPARAAAAWVPRELRSILARALAPVPDERYPTVQALLDDVRAWRAGEVVVAHTYRRLERAVRYVARNARAVLVRASLGLVVAVLAVAVGAERVRSENLAAVGRLASASREGVQAVLAAAELLPEKAAMHALASLAVQEDPDVRGALLQGRRRWQPAALPSIPLGDYRWMTPEDTGAGVACASTTALDVWSIEGDAGRRVASVPLAAEPCAPPVWSTDGRWVAVATIDGSLVQMNRDGGEVRRAALGTSDPFCGIGFVADTSSVVALMQHGPFVRVDAPPPDASVDAAPRVTILTPPTGIANLSGFTMSPDGRTLALSLGSTLSVRDAATAEERWSTQGAAATLIHFPRDGRSMLTTGHASSGGNTFEVYDLETGRRDALTRPQTAGLRALRGSNTLGLLAAYTTDHRVLLYDPRIDVVAAVGMPRSLGTNIGFLAPTRQLVALDSDGVLHRWHLPEELPAIAMTLGSHTNFDLAVSPDGERVGVSDHGDAVYEVAWRSGGTLVRRVAGRALEAIAWLDTDTLLVSARPGELLALPRDEDPTPFSWAGDAYDIAVAPGWIFAGGNAHTVCGWSRADAAAPRWCVPTTDSVGTVAVLPGGDVLAVTFGSDVLRLDPTTGRIRQRLVLDGDGWGTAAVSPDGGSLALCVRTTIDREVATVSQLERIRLPPVDVENPERVPADLTWFAPLDGVSSLAWSPDGTTLGAVALRGGVTFYDADTGRLLARLRGHAPSGWRGAFLDGGRVFASVGGDGLLRTWDLSDLRTALGVGESE